MISKKNLVIISICLFAIVVSIFIIKSTTRPEKPSILRKPINEFSAFQNPHFSIAYAGETDTLKMATSVYSTDGEKIDTTVEVTETGPGKKTIELEPRNSFRPGKYIVKIQDGAGTSYEQNFSWGVLAINTDKPSYLPGEDAKLELAVLDENGDMVCNADLILQIQSPDGTITELQTRYKDIKVNPECNLKDFTLNPDYESVYKTKGTGVYKMILNAKTKNGEYSIEDSFHVKTSNPFQVRRKTATRIYPPKKYPVRIDVTAANDFKGVIEERVPLSFVISPNESGLNYSLIKKERTEQLITWETEFIKGETKTLTYTYDAPDISPQFYLLGPLTFFDSSNINTPIYKEERIWQLASDAIALDQTRTGGSSASTTVSTSASVTGTSNNLYLAAISTKSSVAINSVSGVCTTWTKIGTTQCGGRDQTNIAVFYAQCASPSTAVVTATLGAAADDAVIIVASYSGVDTTSPIGDTVQFNTNDNDGACSGGTDTTEIPRSGATSPTAEITTTGANSVVYGAVATRQRTLTAGTNYTKQAELIQSNGTPGQEAGAAIEDRTVTSSSTTVTLTGTLSNTTDWAVIGVEIMLAAAPTSTPTPTPTPEPGGPRFRFDGLKLERLHINFNWPFFRPNRFVAQT